MILDIMLGMVQLASLASPATTMTITITTKNGDTTAMSTITKGAASNVKVGVFPLRTND